MPNSEFDIIKLKDLANKLAGSIIKKGDSEYDKFRSGWNGYFDKFPLAIVRCTGKNDVTRCVNFVRSHSLKFSVKGGGHDYAGKSICDNGLVIDLSLMNSVNVDPDKKKAIVGPGARWGKFDKAAQEHGLATTGGTVSTVGVAGYTLGGGTGYLARCFGLAADNLISAEVITAGGELLQASEDENPDLFWALRGGGGNFGIVTSFEYRLYEVGPEVRAGQVVHAHEHASEVLRFYRDFMKNASDQLTCYAFLLNIPPVDAFSQQYHGKPALSLVMAHSGPDESAVKELQPLLNFGDPILTAVQPMPYTAAQQMFDAAMPKGNRWYSKAHYLDSLTDEAIKTILKFTESIPGPFSSAYLEPMGGAINRVSPEATAFPHRHSDYGFHIFPGWNNPDSDKKLMSWGKDFFEVMTDHSNGGVYVNLLGHDEKERIDHAYGSNYSKLVRLKKKWDPENLFRSNQNIESM